MFLSDTYLRKETISHWNGTLQTDLENQLKAHVSTYCNALHAWIRSGGRVLCWYGNITKP